MKDYAILVVFASPVLERFLLARHRRRGWELPGGRVEPGEDRREAARREWREETGLPLALLEPLGVHARPDGSRGHLYLGAVSTQAAAPHPEPKAGADPTGQIVAAAWFERLAEAAPLAWPDDPYGALADRILAACNGTGPWRLREAEDPASFRARLADHPDAQPHGDGADPSRDPQARLLPSE